MKKIVADSGGQTMNKGVRIVKSFFALRDFIYTHADKTHAVKFEEIRAFYRNNRLIDGKYDKMIYSNFHALKEIGVKVKYIKSDRIPSSLFPKRDAV